MSAWAAIARLQRLICGPATPDAAPPTKQTALLGAWANLVLTLVLALAMPGPLLALLRTVAR